MAAISVVDLAVRYGSTEVLSGIQLQLAAGQTHVWLGPSGCGKSTLLRCLLGLIPYSGTVTVLGRAVGPATTAPQRQANRRIGFVAQDGGLLPHLSGAANIAVPGELAGWRPSQIESRRRELAALFSLDEAILTRRPHQVSGGQRQRLSLMRALMLDPDVLLLDEPFSALDPLIRAELQDQLRPLFARLGKTVVMVTHDVPEAMHFADTLTVMAQGRIAAHGAPATIIADTSLDWVQTFLRASVPKWRRVVEATQ